jgi:hypothetical protein
MLRKQLETAVVLRIADMVSLIVLATEVVATCRVSRARLVDSMCRDGRWINCCVHWTDNFNACMKMRLACGWAT